MMSGEFTYYRKYIILRDNYTNIEGIKPKGHGKLEIRGVKGAVSLNMENCEPHGDYRIYFLGDIGGKIGEYDLGRVIIDERGRTRTNLSFNIRDLESKGFHVDRLAAIIIRKDEAILLNGYIGQDDGTVDRFIEQLTSGKVEELKGLELTPSLEEKTQPVEREEDLASEGMEEDIESAAKFDREEVEDEIVETEELEKSGPVGEADKVDELIEELEEKDGADEAIGELGEEVDGTIEELDDVDEVLEEIEEISEEDIEAVESIDGSEEWDDGQGFQKIEKEDEVADYKSLEYMRKLNHKNQMTDYILSILRFFPYVDPFNIYLHGYSWWKIEDCNTDLHKGFLPYYNYLMGTDYRYGIANSSTTCIDQIEKYGHYIFGIYKDGKDVKYYLYGVPGRFTTEEHPFRGVTGFNTWYESEDGFGYWILYIDPMTGEVVRIINPMIPEY